MEEQNITITKHAYDRLKERLSLGKKAAERMAAKAYGNGMLHGETNGRLFKYISSRTLTHQIKGSKYVLYGEMVYVFQKKADNNVSLITVFEIPNNLKTNSLKKQKKKSSNDKNNPQSIPD